MDGIKAILLDHKDYSLYKFIDRDKLFYLIIDFDLPIKTLNIITSKLSNK